jgi:hypothetical protein
MSFIQRRSDWWRASDGRWYPPESHPAYSADEAQLKQKVEAARRRLRTWMIVMVSAAVALVVTLAALLVPKGDDQVEPVEEVVSATTPSNLVDVTYNVTGTAPSVAVTLTNAQGNIEQVDRTSLPLTSQAGTPGIRSSTGAYVIASCSGRIP